MRRSVKTKQNRPTVTTEHCTEVGTAYSVAAFRYSDAPWTQGDRRLLGKARLQANLLSQWRYSCGDYAMAMSCLSVCLFIRFFRLSVALLMAARAYRIGHSGCT